MEDFESIVEEYDNKYEEADKEMPSNDEPFLFEEKITITKINS